MFLYYKKTNEDFQILSMGYNLVWKKENYAGASYIKGTQ